MNKKNKSLAEKYLSQKVISELRIGGYSAENYIIQVENRKHFILKILRDNSVGYFDKLEKTTKLLKAYKEIPFKSPKILDRKNKIVIFPYVKGEVLHGSSITKERQKSIVKLLAEFKKVKPFDKTPNSIDLYMDFKRSKKLIDDLLKKIKVQKDSKYSKTLIEILNLKKTILSKYEKETDLLVWLKNSNGFVHGDFHNENILFEKNKIKAALDFELVHSGNPTEDAVNFVWFTFLNSDLSDNNIKKAANFLKLYRKHSDTKKSDITNAFKLTFIRFVQSTVLESSLIDYNEPFYEGLLQRDIKKFYKIDSDFKRIEKLLTQ